MSTKKDQVVGYLPDEKPALQKSLVFAVQQFLVMLPATVLAAIIMNLNGIVIYSIPAAIIASGVATISFLLVTKGKIPLYYGSSFSYIPAVAIVVSFAVANNIDDNAAILGAIMIASIISGLTSIGAGLLIKYFGKDKIDGILPGHITGMVALVIGLSLAHSTIDTILFQYETIEGLKTDWYSVLVSLITFIAIAIFTVILKKGFISQLPILLGLLVGMIFSYLIWIPLSINTQGFSNYFTALFNDESHIAIFDIMPWKTLSAAFANGTLIWVAILAIFPIAFATIPESAAHVNQIDLYVNDLAVKKGSSKNYPIATMLDQNLIADGIADIIAVICAGPAGTNYGENISASAVTKNFSSYVFYITGLLAIITGIILEIFKIGNLSLIITQPVIGGISLYLFGAIAIQGIALMIEKKVNVFDPKVIAVMAFIAIIGLGSSSIVISKTLVLPAIGVAAFGGIILNLLLKRLERFKL